MKSSKWNDYLPLKCWKCHGTTVIKSHNSGWPYSLSIKLLARKLLSLVLSWTSTNERNLQWNGWNKLAMAHRIMVMSFMVDSTKSRWNFGKSFEYKTKLIEKETSWIQQLGAWDISSLGADPPNAWNMYTKIITCQSSLIYLWYYSNFNKSQCLFSFFGGTNGRIHCKEKRKTHQKSRREHPSQIPESKN